MKNVSWLIILVVALVFTGCANKRSGNPKVLVFSKTMGYKHASIPNGIEAIYKLGAENNFEVDTTTNGALFNEDTLKNYSTVIFLSTTLNVLDYNQEAAFERYIQSGGGFVGIHAATDTEYDWNWYGRLVGAYFESHPSGTPEADFVIKDKNFGATNFFTDSIWHRTDELYSFKKINPDINVIMTVDEKTYEGGTNGDYHPMSWYHEYDGGRSFYTGLGHTNETYLDEKFLTHLMGGIKYAIGENMELDYTKAKSQLPPDGSRFSKTQLSVGKFYEPTEMTVLPNNDVLIVQRRGEIILYKNETKELTQVGSLDVYHKALKNTDVNVEEGIMGFQKDPNFDKNNWVYIYYSPTGSESVNRLSRFVFKDDVFDAGSEKVILEIGSDREICCHTGGSVAFGPGGLLYLSTGDNSTPFNEKGEKYVNSGYAPLNDEPGHEAFDARRSSGNTNDLRGKILRIKVNDDGTYDIPEGNLFPEGTEKARPEIYTMGHRNPYRISVDPKNSYVYWGDVGPDAGVDSLETRGPRGYDEMNQAKEAGNFGWPLFIANNKPYQEYDYKEGESGKIFDAERPINTSRNNTGLTELPKAMPAYIYYPYGATDQFPQVGTGGRNAMAGPVFYSDMYPGNEPLPEYYDGKVIIYEWMRGWMKAVSLFPNGDFNKMEPFAPEIEVNNLIDMEIGPNGRIYLLEYGTGWFTPNEDSGLSYIEYSGGNRPPIIDEIEFDKTSGNIPLSIKVKVVGHDRENDDLTYVWDLGNGVTQETKTPNLEYTFSEAGEYEVSVEAIDSQNASAKSNVVAVIAGNTRPEVSIDIKGANSSFFIPGKAIDYEIKVFDKEEGKAIDPSGIYVSLDYMEGMDKVSISQGHQEGPSISVGEELTLSMDCKICHKKNETSIGPSYFKVSEKYQNDNEAPNYLQQKITTGGGGVWGEVAMPAHPSITKDETRQITSWIMSLADNTPKKKSLPVSGSIIPEARPPGHIMVFTASYADKGANNVQSLTGVNSVTLPSNMVSFSGLIENEGFRQMTFESIDLLLIPQSEAWFALKDIDLTGVSTMNIVARWRVAPDVGFNFEAHLDAPDGKLIGQGSMPVPQAGSQNGMVPVSLLSPINERSNIYFTFKPQGTGERDREPAALIYVSFN